MNALRGVDEGRKVRAPQGRVVRNPDCPAVEQVIGAASDGIRKVPQKRDRPVREADYSLLRGG